MSTVEAVCAVFGDPHYRTFDGRLFNFQGACNYVLAEECARNSTGPSFSIRVRNEARSSPEYSWTKSVTIIFDGSRIYLLQNYRVKVDRYFTIDKDSLFSIYNLLNRERVRLPYVHWTNRYSLSFSSNSVTWKGSNGVKVIWDGNSYVEVSVPPVYKGRMCGLCGKRVHQLRHARHFRSPSQGTTIMPSTTISRTEEAVSCTTAHSLETHGRLMAPVVAMETRLLPVPRQSRAHQAKRGRAGRPGSVVCCTETPLPSVVLPSGCKTSTCECQDGVHRNPPHCACFLRSCVTDVCDCPRGKQCACESITAYSRACVREGKEVQGEAAELCGGRFITSYACPVK